MRPRPSPIPVLLALILVIGLVGPVSAEPVPPGASEAAPSGALSAGQVVLRHVESGLANPLGIVNAGDGTGRLFIIEQRGTVRARSKHGHMAAGFFLDLRGVAGGLSVGGERGLLGLAFHPDFETNRKLFAYYTDGDGDLVITELTSNSSRTSVSASTADRLISIEHSSLSNHNGGQLLFGPDGYLYIFTGDGGGGGDPFENGQNRNSLLGKTLRINPNLSGEYTSPSTNPYHGSTPGLGQIWNIGLRNPWRASFDRETDGLWIADVGQGSWEEINREPSGTGGRNYGWDCREGRHPFESAGCSGKTFRGPVAEYGHSGGNCSVTGGYVYRGDVYPDLQGHYVLGDFCSGRIWTLPAGARFPRLKFHRDTSVMISSFGESESGELFLADYARGRLYRVTAP
jgi:glucose/arabinose dehydrogenase